MVTIYYLPWDDDFIPAGPDKLFVKPLDPISNALRFDKPHRGNSHHDQKEKDQ
jgi:hypothetical protein